MKKTLTSLFRICSAVVIGSLLLLTGCQSRFIYFPRAYGDKDVPSWQTKYRGEIIEYKTESGTQRAYLQRQVRQEGPPNRLWIVGAGNGSLALDLAEFLWEYGDPRDAFLLIDYPGYGACEGSPSPSKIKANVLAALPAALAHLKLSTQEMQPRLRLLGHSLGCAAMLQGAKELGIQRGVLISPFTSTMDMTKQVVGVNLGFLVYHRFDNLERLKELKSPQAKFIVIHGTDDEVIPVEMSRELKSQLPELIQLVEIQNGYHNDLFDRNAKEIAASLKALE